MPIEPLTSDAPHDSTDGRAYTHNAETFLAMAREVRAAHGNENEQTAILKRFVAIPPADCDPNAWLEAKAVLETLFSELSTGRLLGDGLASLVQLVDAVPTTRAVEVLADALLKRTEAQDLLRGQASDLLAAFVRRIARDAGGKEPVIRLVANGFPCNALSLAISAALRDAKTINQRAGFYEVLLEIVSKPTVDSIVLDQIQPIVTRLLQELDSTADILGLFVIYELLTRLVLSGPIGRNLLKGSNLLTRTYQDFLHSQAAPDAAFLFDAQTNLLASFASVDADTIPLVPDFLRTAVDEVLQWSRVEPTRRIVVFDRFALIARTSIGRTALESTGRVADVMREWGVAVATGPLELRGRNLDALAETLHTYDDSPSTPALIAKWFEWLSPLGDAAFPRLVTSYLKNPTDELHKPSLNFLLNVVADSDAVARGFAAIVEFGDAICAPTEAKWKDALLKTDAVKALLEKRRAALPPALVTRIEQYLVAPVATQPPTYAVDI